MKPYFNNINILSVLRKIGSKVFKENSFVLTFDINEEYIEKYIYIYIYRKM